MAHSVKIDDKLYVKLKAYCDLNKDSVYRISNAAIEEYLNKIKFGDAPFMKYNENQQNSQEAQPEIDKIPNEICENAKDLEKIDALPTKETDEKITELLTTHRYVEGEIVKENTEQTKEKEVKRPTKRRL